MVDLILTLTRLPRDSFNGRLRLRIYDKSTRSYSPLKCPKLYNNRIFVVEISRRGQSALEDLRRL